MTVPGHILAKLYQEACELELQAFKPGNVSIYVGGHDMTVEDFRISAAVSGPTLCQEDYGLGEAIYRAVRTTREAVGCNTNLGIILLCAPLIRAALRLSGKQGLSEVLRQVLSETTVSDADWVFKAIALANPGGLGESASHDVHKPASVNLTEAMTIASDRDRIALQYASGYKDIFDFAVLKYNTLLRQGRDRIWAAVFLYAEMLSQFPDSHIERRYGKSYTEFVAVRMRRFLEEFSQTKDLALIKPALFNLDAEFKSIGVNPGTTADMTVATILSVLIEEWIHTH